MVGCLYGAHILVAPHRTCVVHAGNSPAGAATAAAAAAVQRVCLLCAAGLAVTSATIVIYGAPVMDPVQLLSHMKQPAAVCVSLFGKCVLARSDAVWHLLVSLYHSILPWHP